MTDKTTAQTRRSFLKSTGAVGGAVACGLRPATLLAQARKQTLLKDGDLETAIKILNLFSEKSEIVNKLYRAIYAALQASPTTRFEAVSKDETVQALCQELKRNHLGGPMLGNLKEDGASVWVRTLNPANVVVQVTVNGETKSFGPVESSFDSDLTATVAVTGLPPGTTSPYQVFVDGKEIAAPDHAAIKTPKKNEACNIVFGTCQHRWGLGNEKMAGQIVRRKPLAFLNYGDIAVQDRRADFGMQRADYALRDFHPAWANIVSSIPVYTSWDDHDYADNDCWGLKGLETEAVKQGTRKIFAQSWNNPYDGFGDDGGGIFHHSRIGPCDVIMTDGRYFREAKGKHCFFGKDQMAWLKKTLLACQGQFIILAGGTMWFDYVSGGKDGLGRFDPEAKEEIFDFIEANQIPGVLLISGDRHGARGFKTERPSGFTFYEFEPASLGGRSGPPAKPKKAKKQQLFGIAGKYAFGEFTFDVSKPDPEVAFRLFGEKGEVIYELALTRSQLTPG